MIDPGAFSEVEEAIDGAAAMLITHEHPDHIEADQVRAALGGTRGCGCTRRVGRRDARRSRRAGGQRSQPGEGFDAGGFAVHTFGRQHALIHPAIPMIANLGYLVDGSVFHPGDSFTVPARAGAELLLPSERTVVEGCRGHRLRDRGAGAAHAPDPRQPGDRHPTPRWSRGTSAGSPDRTACEFQHLEPKETVTCDDASTKAQAFFAKQPIIDGHNDLPWAMRD